MKKNLTSIMLLALMLISSSILAQKKNLIGLWRVQKVSVKDKNMTPVAKWFKINPDGTYQTGNGWLQNGYGNWNYDNVNNMYSASDSLDIVDNFGGFTVSFDDAKMIWKRKEEGMLVKITLQSIEKLPMSPSDYLKGIWDLVEITENGKSIIDNFDSENKHKLFIRWDRIYINFNSEGKRLSGYWHIHGHKPEITLLPHQEDKKPESWRIEVNKKELLMTGISDNNLKIQRKYVRKNTF